MQGFPLDHGHWPELSSALLPVGAGRPRKYRSRHATLSQYSFSAVSGKRDTVLGWVTNRNWEGK
jgi:hypothetical protein